MPKLLANKNYSSEHGTLTISRQYPTLAAKPPKFILIYYFVGVHIVEETQNRVLKTVLMIINYRK